MKPVGIVTRGNEQRTGDIGADAFDGDQGGFPAALETRSGVLNDAASALRPARRSDS